MEVIAGIDLGTTNSLIGVVEAGFPILLADEEGGRLTPSAVYFGPGGAQPVVGAAALRHRVTEPGRTVTSVKRLIGRRPGETGAAPEYALESGTDGMAAVPMDGRLWSPVEISALILGRLREIAERALECPVTRAVITVPAYFNDAQRNATRRAGELAGFTVERILNEPTAAALAFGLEKTDGKSRIAVYDLGGGTFDISILELAGDVFQVLATHGDTRLGGDDLDRALAVRLQALAFPGETVSVESAARLKEAALIAKHTLSTEAEALVQLPFLRGAESFETVVTREEFEALAAPFIDRTRAHCLKALSDAGLAPADLDSVVLVGGSTRIPAVRRMVADVFGREPDVSRHPDETVALGAVLQAGILSGAVRRMVLLDVTPLFPGDRNLRRPDERDPAAEHHHSRQGGRAFHQRGREPADDEHPGAAGGAGDGAG